MAVERRYFSACARFAMSSTLMRASADENVRSASTSAGFTTSLTSAEFGSVGSSASSAVLAARHKLPSRHLEPVLQALVREGILRGVCGPHGGYELAHEHRRISAEDILRAASAAEDADDPPLPNSALVNDVVKPALVEAERTFSSALGRISVEDMAKRAAALK